MLVFIFFYVPSSKLFILIYFDLVVTIEHMEIIAAKLVENAVIQNNVNHINGKCKNGCNSGYQGDKCDEGKCLVNFYLVRPPHFMFD